MFIEGGLVEVDRLREMIASRLPDYMVPRRLHVLNRLPRNVNGKIDRHALLSMLGEGK